MNVIHKIEVPGLSGALEIAEAEGGVKFTVSGTGTVTLPHRAFEAMRDELWRFARSAKQNPFPHPCQECPAGILCESKEESHE